MENELYCCPLSAIQEGQQATVETLLATDSMRRRLLDIGLVSGTKITCLQKSPAGDPVAYLIRGGNCHPQRGRRTDSGHAAGSAVSAGRA